MCVPIKSLSYDAIYPIQPLVSHGQTAFFSLSLGREKKGLAQFKYHTHPDTSLSYVTSMQHMCLNSIAIRLQQENNKQSFNLLK